MSRVEAVAWRRRGAGVRRRGRWCRRRGGGAPSRGGGDDSLPRGGAPGTPDAGAAAGLAASAPLDDFFVFRFASASARPRASAVDGVGERSLERDVVQSGAILVALRRVHAVIDDGAAGHLVAPLGASQVGIVHRDRPEGVERQLAEVHRPVVAASARGRSARTRAGADDRCARAGRDAVAGLREREPRHVRGQPTEIRVVDGPHVALRRPVLEAIGERGVRRRRIGEGDPAGADPHREAGALDAVVDVEPGGPPVQRATAR